jgi:hypothetical protein
LGILRNEIIWTDIYYQLFTKMRGIPDRIRGAKGKKVNSGTGMASVLHSVIEEDCRRQDTDKVRCRRVVSVSSGLMRDSLVSAV